jgi:nucleoside-diphosphate-sugar epimerase
MKKSRESSILVTGCAGFIGSNFVKKFKKDFPKVKIIGLDNLFSGRLSEVDKSITFYKCSILDTILLEKIFKKHNPSYVFHFAAIPKVPYSIKNPIETNEVNINGTVNLLNISSKYKIRRFIFSSSSSVYGGAKNLPTDELEKVDPKSPYAMQKYSAEGFCKIFSNLFGLDTVCLRYFNVFGPGQYGDSAYSSVISSWLENLYLPQKNKESFIEGDGKQSRDFSYVDNIISANMCAMKSNKKFKGEIFNIANGEEIVLIDVYKLIKKYTGKNFVLKKYPSRIGDIKFSYANINKAKRILGYKPIYNFEEGLKKTITWFEGRQKNNEEKNK